MKRPLHVAAYIDAASRQDAVRDERTVRRGSASIADRARAMGCP